MANVTVTVEGHIDDREAAAATAAALGEKRASAVRAELVRLAIAANRIATINLGKNRPAAVGDSEASLAQNRRAAIVVKE